MSIRQKQAQLRGSPHPGCGVRLQRTGDGPASAVRHRTVPCFSLSGLRRTKAFPLRGRQHCDGGEAAEGSLVQRELSAKLTEGLSNLVIQIFTYSVKAFVDCVVRNSKDY